MVLVTMQSRYATMYLSRRPYACHGLDFTSDDILSVSAIGAVIIIYYYLLCVIKGGISTFSLLGVVIISQPTSTRYIEKLVLLIALLRTLPSRNPCAKNPCWGLTLQSSLGR